MSADELLVTDRHLSTCAACAQRLAAAPQLRDTVVRLQSELAAVESEPCAYFSFAQKADYVNRQLSAPEMARAKMHLEQCAECCLALAELQAVRASLVPGRAFVPATQTGWASVRAWFAMPGARWAWRGLGTVAAAAVLVWMGAALWRVRETARPAQTTTTPASTPVPRSVAPGPVPPTPAATPGVTLQPDDGARVALLDGGRQVALDATGKLRGLEALAPAAQAAIKEALTTQQIKVSTQVVRMRAASLELLGKRGEAVEFSLLTPVGQVVPATRPVLKWQALSGAASYYVNVYDASLRKVASSGALTMTEWRPEAELERGRSYYWQVRALRDEQEFFAPAPSAPDAKFKILERSQLAEIEQAQTVHTSHLALGVLYARAGMLDEAGQEFKTLAAANPHSPVARRILQSFERQTRGLRP